MYGTNQMDVFKIRRFFLLTLTGEMVLWRISNLETNLKIQRLDMYDLTFDDYASASRTIEITKAEKKWGELTALYMHFFSILVKIGKVIA